MIQRNVIAFSEILTAFNSQTIGSKVIDEEGFLDLLYDEILNFDLTKCRQPGQMFVNLPWSACALVSGGAGLARDNPDDYVLRSHRGKVGAYLKREFAEPVDTVACVVYTMDAYRTDPDCTAAEIARVEAFNPTHVLIAVLASSGAKASPLSPFRLVHNLAGGNLEAALYTADEIRQKAKESLAYHNTWSTIAD